MFDDRLVTLTIKIGNDTYTFDQEYYIAATGIIFTGGLFGQSTIKIDNISKQVLDTLITKTTVWRPNRTTANVSLSIGRASYGTFEIFNGGAIASNPSQPPNIGMIIQSNTLSTILGQPNAFTAGSMTTIKSLCQSLAQSFNVPLVYEATSQQQVGNYHFVGPLSKQIMKINDLGIVKVSYVNSQIVVTDLGAARKLPVVQVDTDHGLIGVPEVTEKGVRVKVLITNEIKLGSPVTVTSTVNPAANGNFTIFKLGYEIASRDTPFYYVLDLQPNPLTLGALAQ